jgi:hypothetical protein
MKPLDYLKPYIQVINNHVTIKKIEEEGGPFCQKCLAENDILEPAPFNENRNAWVCKHGHVGSNGGYANSSTTYGPR